MNEYDIENYKYYTKDGECTILTLAISKSSISGSFNGIGGTL